MARSASASCWGTHRHDPAEYLQISALAAEAGAPTFTRARELIELAPNALIDGAEEIVGAAAQTGAHMHYCHIDSTSMRHIDRVLDLVGRAQAAGSRISTEAYPYGSGMTESAPPSWHPAAARARPDSGRPDLCADRRAGRQRGTAARVARH